MAATGALWIRQSVISVSYILARGGSNIRRLTPKICHVVAVFVGFWRAGIGLCGCWFYLLRMPVYIMQIPQFCLDFCVIPSNGVS